MDTHNTSSAFDPGTLPKSSSSIANILSRPDGSDQFSKFCAQGRSLLELQAGSLTTPRKQAFLAD